MRRKYEKIEFHLVPLYANRAVAAVCWAHASSGKPMYFDISGSGYAEIIINSYGQSCSSDITVDVTFSNPNFTEEQKAYYISEVQAAIARAHAMGGNHMPPFKNNDMFFPSPSPSWS